MLACCAAALAYSLGVDALMLDRLRLPPGFSIDVYASGVADARQMALADDGVVFVGTRREGKVYAVVDRDKDYRADHIYTIAAELFMPSGVAFRDGTLYVAEANRILAFDAIVQHLDNPPQPRVVFDQLPSESYHGWKYIDFGPDGKLYIPVGAPCNSCEVEDPFGTILRIDPQRGEPEYVARGVRNSVGFTWHPQTKELWFTDNGRDWMGDDVPFCELNRVTEPGQHFGFPFVHAGDVPDPEYGADVDVDNYVRPAWNLGPHVAPLGIIFYQGSQFPQRYRESFLIAEHGSWNRDKKSGYRIMAARIGEAGEVIDYTPFISGWLVGQATWGRPVDLEELSDGSVLVSDDFAGVIYRVVYDPATDK